MAFDLDPEEMEEDAQAAAAAPPPAKKQADRFATWEDDTTTSEKKKVDDEIAEYRQMRLTDKPDPDLVLAWWGENKERFPALSKLARFIHSIPASSAPSERAFSVCGRILEERRTNLASESISNILFLNSNLKKLDKAIV